jgi:hypothetical protein
MISRNGKKGKDKNRRQRKIRQEKFQLKQAPEPAGACK